jgi:hypothetical protein
MKKNSKNISTFDVEKILIEDFDYDCEKTYRRQKWNKKKK